MSKDSLHHGRWVMDECFNIQAKALTVNLHLYELVNIANKNLGSQHQIMDHNRWWRCYCPWGTTPQDSWDTGYGRYRSGSFTDQACIGTFVHMIWMRVIYKGHECVLKRKPGRVFHHQVPERGFDKLYPQMWSTWPDPTQPLSSNRW
jgi:hypothetical protein